jgi:hypothetical protein
MGCNGRDSIPGKGKKSPYIPQRPNRLWVPPSVRGSKAGHSHPYSAEVKNGWSNAYAAQLGLHGKNKQQQNKLRGP